MFSYYQYSQNYVKDNFDIDLTVPIEVNGRLSRALGRFISRKGQPHKIELSRSLLEDYDAKTILDVLNHELIHYALCTLKKPHNDNDTYFINTCKRLNVSLTGKIEAKSVYQYQCNCRILESTRRRHLKNYRCSDCKGDFTYIGKRKL